MKIYLVIFFVYFAFFNHLFFLPFYASLSFLCCSFLSITLYIGLFKVSKQKKWSFDIKAFAIFRFCSKLHKKEIVLIWYYLIIVFFVICLFFLKGFFKKRKDYNIVVIWGWQRWQFVVYHVLNINQNSFIWWKVHLVSKIPIFVFILDINVKSKTAVLKK